MYVDIPWYIRIFCAEKLENGERFTIHSSIWQSEAKGEWRVSNWLAISNTLKIILIFDVYCWVFSRALEIHVKQRKLYDESC